MNPVPVSDGGGHDMFDVWASLVLPTLGILVAIAIPLIVLYWQRNADARRLSEQRDIEDRRVREERERSDQRLTEERELSAAQLADERSSAAVLRAEEAAERIQTARKVAIRNVVAELAPFIGMDLYREDLDVHPYLVDLRIAAMALVDEYPVEHPINELVGYHQHLGMSTARAIQEDTVARERAAVDIEERLVALGPMHRWAAQYTADMRSILTRNVTDDQMRARSREVAGTTAVLYARNGWGDPPGPNIR